MSSPRIQSPEIGRDWGEATDVLEATGVARAYSVCTKECFGRSVIAVKHCGRVACGKDPEKRAERGGNWNGPVVTVENERVCCT